MLQEEFVFAKSCQDQACDATMLIYGFSVDENIIEVHAQYSFHNEVLKYLIHHCLKGRRTIHTF